MYLRLSGIVAAISTVVFAATAQAAITFDQNVTNNVIFGSGNANGGFTVDRANNVELGLRAKVRYPVPANVYNSNGDGTYNHAAGPGVPASRAMWNFEWSINSDLSGTSGRNVGVLTYALSMDFDSGVGTNFQTFDLINAAPCFDHSFGNNATTDATDSKTLCSAVPTVTQLADYANLKTNNNLAQNSWNLDFFDNLTFLFDPTLNGNYSFVLQAFDVTGARLARTEITVIVGDGAEIPEPGSLALAGLALGALALRRRKL